MTQILKGNIVAAPELGRLDITEHGYLTAEDGKITGVFADLPERYRQCDVQDWGDCLILQAPADMHVHGPQYAMMGLGLDKPLLEWLQSYAFPTERRFTDLGFAREVYRRLAHDLIANGTTRVAMFSSLHTDATLVLMEELEKAGIVGLVGKVNMDQNGAEGLQETTEGSMAETLRWLEGCERFTRVRPVLTPRFVPSCTGELLAFLGRLAAERDLPVQSHLSENHQEIELVARLHPDCPNYGGVYAKYGLWTDRTLMAHCVHSDGAERAAMKAAGVTVVHCPNSNNSICSGIAPVRKMLDEGLKVALGTDVAGGSHLSMFGAVEDALRCSKDRRILDNWETPHLTVAEAWYLATTAGERFFGAKGGFAPGDPLHAVVLDDSRLLTPYPLTVRDRFERCVYQRQDGWLRAVWSEGRQVL
ncbi:amidohydrolase family protein [Dysosmobacter sp.]|uniref:amidohydrolase family protein n=1 Tax=Dysosmobacter sp. TaxID=2591382 RepID=UPI002A85DC78|nr:amidohydrolase family protein [Dysosmobacter sp.]MDY3281649.1 amidohydrolase family protein [Dysosmobacter sp.]